MHLINRKFRTLCRGEIIEQIIKLTAYDVKWVAYLFIPNKTITRLKVIFDISLIS